MSDDEKGVSQSLRGVKFGCMCSSVRHTFFSW